MSERDLARSGAKVAHLCHLVPEAVKQVLILADNASIPLSEEERELFCQAFRSSINSLRASWRVLWNEEKKQEAGANDRLRFLAKCEKNKVEHELVQTAKTAINALQSMRDSDPGCSDPLFMCFLEKLIGDFSRYMVDIYKHYPESYSLMQESTEQADFAYKSAVRRSVDKLSVTYLATCLNYSLFQFETLRKPKAACILARDTLEICQRNLNLIKDDTRKLTLMQSLHDNLVFWTSIRS